VQRVVQYLDLVVLVPALIVFVALGLPLLGFVVATVAWLLQRVIQVLLTRKADASDDPRTVVGLTAGGAIARGWLVAAAILVAGLSDKDAGLSAAVLVIVLYTAYFAGRLITRPRDPAARGGAA
jgi:hypothetical protein